VTGTNLSDQLSKISREDTAGALEKHRAPAAGGCQQLFMQFLMLREDCVPLKQLFVRKEKKRKIFLFVISLLRGFSCRHDYPIKIAHGGHDSPASQLLVLGQSNMPAY
jgi:hypothetical protein